MLPHPANDLKEHGTTVLYEAFQHAERLKGPISVGTRARTGSTQKLKSKILPRKITPLRTKHCKVLTGSLRHLETLPEADCLGASQEVDASVQHQRILHSRKPERHTEGL